jgi:hypothetical protein
MKRGWACSERARADGASTIFWLLDWCGVEIIEHDSEPLVRILFDHRVQEAR